MMHGVTGKTHLEVGGKLRTLSCDMNAADIFYAQRGEQWQLWLAQRFLGNEVEMEDGRKARQLTPISPGETMETLYALLTSDMQDNGQILPADLNREFGIADLQRVTAAVLGAVMAGFGLPGEYIEAVVNAAAGPR